LLVASEVEVEALVIGVSDVEALVLTEADVEALVVVTGGGTIGGVLPVFSTGFGSLPATEITPPR
jgi:hypothetical protein